MMDASGSIERLNRYLEAHSRITQGAYLEHARKAPGPVITLSREAGAGGSTVAEKLSVLLEKSRIGRPIPWAIMDKNLAERALSEHNLPALLAENMPEARMNEVQDFVAQVMGVSPGVHTLVDNLNETIRRLVQIGNVIVVGRGAAVIAADESHALHVRLVCPLRERVARTAHKLDLGTAEAEARVQREDRDRRNYLKKHFSREVADPLLYHLVINTGRLSADETVSLIAAALQGHSGLGPAARNAPGRPSAP